MYRETRVDIRLQGTVSEDARVYFLTAYQIDQVSVAGLAIYSAMRLSSWVV